MAWAAQKWLLCRLIRREILSSVYNNPSWKKLSFLFHPVNVKFTIWQGLQDFLMSHLWQISTWFCWILFWFCRLFLFTVNFYFCVCEYQKFLRPSSHYTRDIRKHSFIFMVRPTVHTDVMKREPFKMLFKTGEFENASFTC